MPRHPALALVLALLALGCGRSVVDDVDAIDAGPDGGAAAGGVGGSAGTGASGGAGTGASGGTGGVGGATGGSGGVGGIGGFGGGPNCGPCDGCCDAAGICRPGKDSNACGKGGTVCFDCGSIGFGCVDGTCEGTAPPCGPGTCDGCCDAAGQCHFGNETDACGEKGGACSDCTALGLGCNAGVCEGPPPKCSAQNCGGCCDATDNCLPGNVDTSCGATGAACENCLPMGKKCNQPGSYCAFLPTCGPFTCASGCCDDSGVCRNGQANQQCGNDGAKCSDCTQFGLSCAPQGFCYQGTHCGQDNCAGCCTATGVCVAGAGSTACGQFGKLCQNCAASGNTCIGQACTTGGNCPAPYGGCLPPKLTAPPVASTSCSGADLSTLANACAGTSDACSKQFEKLLTSNPPCYDCMLQFAADDAYARCLAPFLTPDCNHQVTCAVECGNETCGECSDAEADGCSKYVFGKGGSCGEWINGYYCNQAALAGPGAFCKWNDALGPWLLSVGSHYCAAL
ncbi:MAG: hypothetical protein H6717_12660 [Polyangiaceae bacterium]|nr:hypothetical protein [Polyangiaceae bacterium]